MRPTSCTSSAGALRLGLRVDAAQPQPRLAHFAHHPLSRVSSAAISVTGTSQGHPFQKSPLRSRLSSLVSATTRRRRSASHRRRRWRRRRPLGSRRVALLLLRVDHCLRTNGGYLFMHHSSEHAGSARAAERATAASASAAAAGVAVSPRVALSEAGRAAARAWRNHGLFYGNHGGRRTAHRADLGG